MKDIFYNNSFFKRTDEQQQIIDLVSDNFPSSGYPRHIIRYEDFIVISSHLVYLSIGYKHLDYESEVNRKTNRICIYSRQKKKLIFKEDLKYAVNSILKVDDKILIGTGACGQPSGGELFEFNLSKNSFRSCTSESYLPISIMLDKGSYIEICSFLQTGADEGENRVYKLDKKKDFQINYQTDQYDRIITDDELEEMYNREENTVTTKNLKDIISN